MQHVFFSFLSCSLACFKLWIPSESSHQVGSLRLRLFTQGLIAGIFSKSSSFPRQMGPHPRKLLGGATCRETCSLSPLRPSSELLHPADHHAAIESALNIKMGEIKQRREPREVRARIPRPLCGSDTKKKGFCLARVAVK